MKQQNFSSISKLNKDIEHKVTFGNQEGESSKGQIQYTFNTRSATNPDEIFKYAAPTTALKLRKKGFPIIQEVEHFKGEIMSADSDQIAPRPLKKQISITMVGSDEDT